MRDLESEIVPGFPGLETEALMALVERVEAECADRPYIVAKTRMLRAFLDNVRLMVRADDVFVDMVADTTLLSAKRDRRCRDFALRTPELAVTAGGWRSTHGAFVAQLDPSHTCPDWESVLSLGFTGLAERARRRLRTARDGRERVFLECVADAYEAASCFCLRWADAADRRGARACAASLRALAKRPPRTLREALQMMLLYDRLQEIEGDYVRTQGLFDRLYIGYYREDVRTGRETRATAKALVRAVFDKFHSQGHPNGKNIGFGGLGPDGKPVWNELTEIGLELHRELNRPNPKLAFRYGKATPDAQMLQVCRCLAEGRTSIVLFNDDVGREMFLRRGKSPEDLSSAVLVGCYEPAIMGRETIASMGGWINLAKPLEAALNGGRGFDGFRIGPDCVLPRTYAEFEREYFRQLEALTERTLSLTRLYERHGWQLNPSPLFSGGLRDCVANARDAYDGGCKYNQTGVMCAGLATAVDSLAAVRFLVEERGTVTMTELAEILKDDWRGHDDLRRLVRASPPKWGNNDERADALAKALYGRMTARINAERNGHGGTFQAGFWSIDDDIRLGRLTGATPEGRKAGSPISRNNVATAGCGREGPTALVLSAAKLDQAESPDGFILDVILPSGGISPASVAGFIRTFAAQGGQSIHLNVFDAFLLRDAQTHPEKYADLQVRVCGWNVRWNDLSKEEQDHFIATAGAQEL